MLTFGGIVQYSFHYIAVLAEFLPDWSIFSEMFLEYVFDYCSFLVVACENYESMFQVLPISRRDLV